MKIYSGMGDKGYTSLLTGERVEKCGLRVSAYGSVDELQAHLGFARSLVRHELIGNYIYQLQSTLMHAMSELASPGTEARITEFHVDEVERAIDVFAELLPKGFAFRVPGESVSSAALHVCRAHARRCERELHALAQEEHVGDHLLALFNRVSDFCYVMARLEDEHDDEIDEPSVQTFVQERC